MASVNLSGINTDQAIFDIVRQGVTDVLCEAVECINTSPDYPALAKWDSHYVFAYGTLKAGFRRDRNLAGSKVVGVGYTKNHFEMFRTDTNQSFPVLLSNEAGRAHHIYGEVYKVPTWMMRDLDYIESNTFKYQRIRVPIDTLMDSKTGISRQIYAWTYIGVPTYWSYKKDLLIPCDILTSKQDTKFSYYNFMKKYELENT
jgi:gamma-glutamylcyclotransferase (GGCT)/AIG2-like uncharacterized protein YtfP